MDLLLPVRASSASSSAASDFRYAIAWSEISTLYQSLIHVLTSAGGTLSRNIARNSIQLQRMYVYADSDLLTPVMEVDLQ